MSFEELLRIAVREEVRAIIPQLAQLVGKPAPDTDPDLSIDEAAERTGVSPSTIKAWVKLGALPSHKYKGSRLKRVLLSHVEACRRTMRATPTPASNQRIEEEAQRILRRIQ